MLRPEDAQSEGPMVLLGCQFPLMSSHPGCTAGRKAVSQGQECKGIPGNGELEGEFRG